MPVKLDRELLVVRRTAYVCLAFNVAAAVTNLFAGKWYVAFAALAWVMCCLFWVLMLIPSQQKTRNVSCGNDENVAGTKQLE